MDISFTSGNSKFNYRVGAIILNGNKILAMRDERSPYYYLVGGRVKLGETAEQAILRELKEELGVAAKTVRPLFFNQSFFNEDVDRLDYHELCVYYLVDLTESGILSLGERFERREGAKTLWFEWLELSRLKDEYFYPLFLKERIFSLPDSPEFITEYE